jgi:uncharacterized protein (UPF0261 family)
VGKDFYDPNADRVFMDTLKAKLNPSIIVQEVDAHINDIKFAEIVVEEFMKCI